MSRIVCSNFMDSFISVNKSVTFNLSTNLFTPEKVDP